MSLMHSFFSLNYLFVFLSYAIKHFVHLINRTPTSLLRDKSPYQMVYNEIPDLSYKKF